MRAVGLTRYLPIDDPQSLQDIELPRPEPGPNDLLVRVEAVSVNPVDTKVRAPKDVVEPQPRVLGYDAAGVVEAVGREVTLFQPGDEVYYAGDITRPGSNAQYQLADERIAGASPVTLDFAEAAALPLTTITAWELLFERMPFDFDAEDNRRTLLVVAGAGGVGSIAIQLARHAGYFDPHVEFYHDTGGVTWTREAMLANTRQYACGKFTRERVPGTLVVHPVRGFGAIAQGQHRFCQAGSGACEGLADFTIVWQRQQDGQWRITRVLSYGHRANPGT